MESAITSDKVGMQLHDRATRGEVLTAEERSQLENWYIVQDAQESESLQQSATLPDVFQLRVQIDAALANLTLTAQRIQQATAENETIRDEIAVLRQQLSSAKSA